MEGAPPPPAAPHDIFAKCRTDEGYFGTLRAQSDQYFSQPELEGALGPRMKFQGKDVIVWSLNNYLGLARDPRVLARAQAALLMHTTAAPMGSRMLTGNTGLHQELEGRLARYLGAEAAIVWNYGYMGVMGTIDALVGPRDTVIVDRRSHACIVDAARMAGRRVVSFRHNDVDHLRRLVEKAAARPRGGILIVTEGVFGMTGDVAPLPQICALKEEFGARLFVDDAHGFGVMGATGRGAAEHLGCREQVGLHFGTFAKSFAAIGGVTAGDKAVVDWVRYNARTNVFAKSLPLVYVAALLETLDIVESEPEHRTLMWRRADLLQTGLTELGYHLGETRSPITPVYVPAGDPALAMQMVRMLRSGELGDGGIGIFVSGVVYPVVSKGVVLFRLIPTAAHSEDDIAQTLSAFRDLRDRLGLRLQPELSP